MNGWPYVWRVNSRPLEARDARAGVRKGQRCRVLVRGSMNSWEESVSD